ncbi:hypothetical protein MN116_006544 [Schistosoma mekongi]|uniref:Cyclin-dependent kinase 5 activator n=1 Tax=Schistosoma mekongi TaxID=38744 RepID=A0AAE2D4P7_SCHME|nr:hypothetical protein MN116_006544 [Schistosoma mekongi]
MSGLKRLLFSGLSRKTKVFDANGIISSLGTSHDQINELSIKSDEKNTTYNSTNQSSIEIPIYYYKQQQQQQQHLEDNSSKIINGIRNIQLDNHQLTSALSSPYCDILSSKGVSQIKTTHNSCHFQSRDEMNDTVSEEYYSSDQKSLINIKSPYEHDFTIHNDTTNATVATGQRRQLSEPNSRLKHRYSHCLSTDFKRKCCATHHHHHNIDGNNNNSNINSNTVPYTPSLVDLTSVPRLKSSNNKQSNKQLYASNSPYSFMDNNCLLKACHNTNYLYIPTSTISETMCTQMSTFVNKTLPVDTYPTEYHHYQPTQHNYHQYQNNQLLGENITLNMKQSSPSTRSCSFDIHFPVYNQCDNQNNQLNVNLSTDKNSLNSIHVPSLPSKHSVNSIMQNVNSSCAHNCLSMEKFNISTNHANYNNKIEKHLSNQFIRRFTEFNKDSLIPSSPIHCVQRKVNVTGIDKYRNITKSISCYALKLFNQHHHHHHHNQQKYKKDSNDTTTTMTRSFYRINDRNLFKLHSDKNDNHVKRNYSTHDINEFKQYSSNQQMHQSNHDVITTTTGTKSINTVDSNQNTLISLYHRNDLQSDDCSQCFNHRKSTEKINEIYGMFDYKCDRYHNVKHFSHDDRSHYGKVRMQTHWRQYETQHDPNQSGGGKFHINTSTIPTTTNNNHDISTNTTIPNDYNLFRPPIFKANTSELLKCLSFFIVAHIQMNLLKNANRLRNSDLHGIQPGIIVAWIRAIDRALLLQGWSEVAFINPTHVVFLYMMLRTFIQNGGIQTERELHTIIMACLYLAYSYTGNEISYPLKPFLIAEANQFVAHSEGGNKKLLSNAFHALTSSSTITNIENCLKSKVIDEIRNRFWQYVIRIVNEKSTEMLRINAEPILFAQMFKELTSYENVIVAMKLSSHNHHFMNDNSNNKTTSDGSGN